MSFGTHITNWDGAIPSTSGSIQWVDLYSVVMLQMSSVSGTAQTGSSIDMITSLPAGLRPSSTRVISGTAISGGNTESAYFTIGTDGSMSVTLASNDDFSSSGTNGFANQGLNYIK